MASHLEGVTFREERLSALTFSLVKATHPGFIAEFGVATGNTLNHLCELTDEVVYGFDSFAGLPEAWREGFPQGAFAVQNLSKLRFAFNAALCRGLFKEEIPQFLMRETRPARFIHMDCDLKSSTLDVLFGLNARIQVGTVIQFDEFFGYHGFELHQYAALQEYCAKTAHQYEFICYTGHEQVSIRFTH